MLSAVADSLDELQQSVAACSRTIAALQSLSDFSTQPGHVNRMTACSQGKLSCSSLSLHEKERYRRADEAVPPTDDAGALGVVDDNSSGRVLHDLSSKLTLRSEPLSRTALHDPVSRGARLFNKTLNTVFIYRSGMHKFGLHTRRTITSADMEFIALVVPKVAPVRHSRHSTCATVRARQQSTACSGAQSFSYVTHHKWLLHHVVCI